MIKTFIEAFKINSTYKTNSFLYKIRKLWIFRKLIPNDVYRLTDVKIILNIIIAIFSYLFEFVKKAIYFIFFFMLPISMMSSSNDSVSAFIWIFLFLNLFIGSFGKQIIMSPTLEKYYSVILMHMDAKKYAITDYIHHLLVTLISFLPSLFLFGYWNQVPLWTLAFLLLSLIGSRMISEAMFVMIYDKWKYVIANRSWYVLTIFGLGLIGAYSLSYFHVSFPPLFLLPLSIMIILIAIPSFLYLLHYQKYSFLYKRLITRENVIFDTDKIIRESQLETVKMDEHSTISNEMIEKKKGFEYFNAIFFERHKRILTKSVKQMTGVIFLIIVGSIIVLFFAPELKDNIHRFLMTSLPYFVFIMYALNRGQVICKAMFFNCDHSMLTYQFYRTSKNMLENFKVRLKMLIRLNLLPAFVLAIGLDLLLWMTGGVGNPFVYFSMFFSIIFMSIFFSVHHLVLYYLLQPYDINMDRKSSIYDIVNAITYFICWSCIEIKLDSFYFSLGTIVLTTIYVVVALYLAYLEAPKRFKLK